MYMSPPSSSLKLIGYSQSTVAIHGPFNRPTRTSRGLKYVAGLAVCSMTLSSIC